MSENAKQAPDLDTMTEASGDLLRGFQAGESSAIDRVHQHLPQVKFGSRASAAGFPLSLDDARTVIARERDCMSWGELRLKLKLREQDYGEALDRFIALVYAQEAAELDALLTAQPQLRDTIDDPHFYFGSTALIIAKEERETVDVLLKHGADINAKSQWWAGDFHILEGTSPSAAAYLIERGAEINVHAAVEQGWLEWLDEAYGRDPAIIHQRAGDGKTPLHYATDPAVMDWLLERGADLEARDLDHESTPLQWQLGAQKLDVARELVERGAAVDIFAAVILGDLAMVERALDEQPEAIRARVNSAGYELAPKADGSHQYVYTFNAANLSPHQAALEYGHDEIFALLTARSPIDAQLLAHCAAGAEDAARQIVAANPGIVAQVSAADSRQLIYAAWSNQIEVARLMASLGFDLHVIDDDRMTPLHAAAFHGFVEVIQALLEADEEPPLDWLNGYGGTPLATCLYGKRHGWRGDGDYPASIKLLVDAGSEARADWLPSGDDAIDEIFSAALEAQD